MGRRRLNRHDAAMDDNRYCQINRIQGDNKDTEGEWPADFLLCSGLRSRDLPPDVPSIGHLLAILSDAKAVTSGTEV